MADEPTTTESADPTEGGTTDPAADAAAEQAKEQKAESRKSSKKDSSSDRRLVAYVHLNHPVTGERMVYGPDDEVPDWAAELITNPKAWDGGLPHAIDENAPVPGANQFATTGADISMSKTQAYTLDKEELVKLNEQAGIEANMDMTKRTLVENLYAR